jgi:hypothetical protein
VPTALARSVIAAISANYTLVAHFSTQINIVKPSIDLINININYIIDFADFLPYHAEYRFDNHFSAAHQLTRLTRETVAAWFDCW